MKIVVKRLPLEYKHPDGPVIKNGYGIYDDKRLIVTGDTRPPLEAVAAEVNREN